MKQEITKPENLITVPQPTMTYDPNDDYAAEAAEDKFKADREAAKNRPVVKGSIVCIRGSGWKRVTAVFKDHVNVGPVFGGRGRFSGIVKGIPLEDVFEDEERWYAWWQTTETYQCM